MSTDEIVQVAPEPLVEGEPLRALERVRIAALVSNDGVEDSELTIPVDTLRSHGASVDIVAPRSGHVSLVEGLRPSRSVPADRTLGETDPMDYSALLIPGGVANADRLRMDAGAVAFVRSFADRERPIGVMCHGAWLLVEADVVHGRTVSSWPSLRTDIRNAGGTWVDEAVWIDENLVSSRKQDDLGVFCAAIRDVFAGSTDVVRDAHGPTAPPGLR